MPPAPSPSRLPVALGLLVLLLVGTARAVNPPPAATVTFACSPVDPASSGVSVDAAQAAADGRTSVGVIAVAHRRLAPAL